MTDSHRQTGRTNPPLLSRTQRTTARRLATRATSAPLPASRNSPVQPQNGSGTVGKAIASKAIANVDDEENQAVRDARGGHHHSQQHGYVEINGVAPKSLEHVPRLRCTKRHQRPNCAQDRGSVLPWVEPPPQQLPWAPQVRMCSVFPPTPVARPLHSKVEKRTEGLSGVVVLFESGLLSSSADVEKDSTEAQTEEKRAQKQVHDTGIHLQVGKIRSRRVRDSKDATTKFLSHSSLQPRERCNRLRPRLRRRRRLSLHSTRNPSSTVLAPPPLTGRWFASSIVT